MRPEDLAPELEISAKHLRGWLRKQYPRPADMKHQPWNLTEAQVRAARAHFASGPRRAESRDEMRVTTVALPERIHAQLSKAAQQRGTVMTELVRQAVAEWLQRNAASLKGGK